MIWMKRLLESGAGGEKLPLLNGEESTSDVRKEAYPQTQGSFSLDKDSSDALSQDQPKPEAQGQPHPHGEAKSQWLALSCDCRHCSPGTTFLVLTEEVPVFYICITRFHQKRSLESAENIDFLACNPTTVNISTDACALFLFYIHIFILQTALQLALKFFSCNFSEIIVYEM